MCSLLGLEVSEAPSPPPPLPPPPLPGPLWGAAINKANGQGSGERGAKPAPFMSFKPWEIKAVNLGCQGKPSALVGKGPCGTGVRGGTNEGEPGRGPEGCWGGGLACLGRTLVGDKGHEGPYRGAGGGGGGSEGLVLLVLPVPGQPRPPAPLCLSANVPPGPHVCPPQAPHFPQSLCAAGVSVAPNPTPSPHPFASPSPAVSL